MTTRQGNFTSRLVGCWPVRRAVAGRHLRAGDLRAHRGQLSPVRPVARAAVVTAAVIGTAAVVGSVVRSLPPSCSTMVVDNVPYQHCGNAWYQPRYSGSQVTYVVVNPPPH